MLTRKSLSEDSTSILYMRCKACDDECTPVVGDIYDELDGLCLDCYSEAMAEIRYEDYSDQEEEFTPIYDSDLQD